MTQGLALVAVQRTVGRTNWVIQGDADALACIDELVDVVRGSA